MGLRDFFNGLASAPNELPHFFRIPDANIANKGVAGGASGTGGAGGAFVANEHYFSLDVNEMYLTESRRWLSEIEPMVISLTEYSYASQFISNPFVVGSSMLRKKMQGEGEGFVFRDTRVAGLHPYTGGRLIINIALYRVATRNVLTGALKFLENVSGVFNENISLLVKSSLKAVNVVVAGIDDMVDGQNIKPLFGFHKEFDPAREPILPGYFVMLDKSGTRWEPERFFVGKDNNLQYGADASAAQPFREDEYILFSLNKSDERNDYNQLPVYKSFEDILDFAQKFPEITDDQKKQIKGMLYSLNFDMIKSPDLTTGQASRLMAQFVETVKKAVEPRFNFGAVREKEMKYQSGGQPQWANEMEDKIAAF